MCQGREDTFYSVLKWNGKSCEEKFRMNEDEFLRLSAGLNAIAEMWHYDADNKLYYYPTGNNKLQSHVSYNGNDYGINVYRETIETAFGPIPHMYRKRYNKEILFRDSYGRIVDPRTYPTKDYPHSRKEYLAILDLIRGEKLRSHECPLWRSYTWKYVSRQDRNPEYKRYRRKGATISKSLVRTTEKCWKRQTKCRKQWEKHLPRHTQYYSLPEIPEEFDEFADISDE